MTAAGRFCVLLALATLAGAGSARAAPFNWSGWYVTGSVGWGWRAQNAYPPNSYYTSLGANFAGGAGYGGSGGSGTPRYNGPAAAAGFGYNYQWGNFILGAEYEFLYADVQTKPTHARTSFTNGPGPFATAFVVSNYDTVNGDANRWYGIGRIRAGMPMLSDRGWFYLTGGAAYRLSYASEDPVIKTIPYLTPTTTVTMSGYNKSHPWGLALGTGFEYAAWDNWFVRGEWLHLDFGHDTYLDPVATALTGNPKLLSFARHADIARLGMVYRFSGGGY